MKITVFEFVSILGTIFLIAVEYCMGISLDLEKKVLSFVIISLVLAVFLVMSFGKYGLILPIYYLIKYPPLIILVLLLLLIDFIVLGFLRAFFGYPGDIRILTIIGLILNLVIGKEIRKTKNFIPISLFGINFIGSEAYKRNDTDKKMVILIFLVALWGINLISLASVFYEEYIECFLEKLGLFEFLDKQGIFINRSQCYGPFIFINPNYHQ